MSEVARESRPLSWRSAGLAAAVLAAVVLLHDDYGVTWDEGLLATYGEMALDYFLSGGRDLRATDYFNLHRYGAALETLAAGAYRLLDSPPFETRHFIIGSASALALPGLVWFGRRFRDPAVPVLAVAALVALPRFVGHAFNNSKDAPFAVAVVWFLAAAAALFIEHDYRWRRVAGCAAALGAALWIRPGALPLLLAYLGTIGVLAFTLARPAGTSDAWNSLLRALGAAAVILPVAWLLMVLPWPWAHVDPIGRPLEVMGTSAAFPRTYEVLFRGASIRSDLLPRSYLPHFLLVTTPPTLLLLASLGTVRAARTVLVEPRGPARAAAGTALAWLALPLAAYLVVHPNVYDGIRHFLFLLPGIAVLAALGASWIMNVSRPGVGRRLTWAIVAVCLAAPLIQTVRLHPYQIAYFNLFVGGTAGAEGRYETEYWASSYGEAMEWINRRPRRRANGSLLVHAAGPEDVEPAAAHAAASDVSVVSDDDLRRDPALRDRLDYYVATTRFGFDERYPEAPVVHRVGRAGVTFTVVKVLAAASSTDP